MGGDAGLHHGKNQPDRQVSAEEGGAGVSENRDWEGWAGVVLERRQGGLGRDAIELEGRGQGHGGGGGGVELEEGLRWVLRRIGAE